jgi:hypothetical protein
MRSELTRTTHERFSQASDRYSVGAGEMSVLQAIEDAACVSLRVEGDWIAPWEVSHADDQ